MTGSLKNYATTRTNFEAPDRGELMVEVNPRWAPPPMPQPRTDPTREIQVLRIAARLLQRHRRDTAAADCFTVINEIFEGKTNQS